VIVETERAVIVELDTKSIVKQVYGRSSRSSQYWPLAQAALIGLA